MVQGVLYNRLVYFNRIGIALHGHGHSRLFAVTVGISDIEDMNHDRRIESRSADRSMTAEKPT